jgi:hypothetical protein
VRSRRSSNFNSYWDIPANHDQGTEGGVRQLAHAEVGYLTYGTDAANMLFHVVNERHRRHRSMIFTTNRSLKAWGQVTRAPI